MLQRKCDTATVNGELVFCLFVQLIWGECLFLFACLFVWSDTVLASQQTCYKNVAPCPTNTVLAKHSHFNLQDRAEGPLKVTKVTGFMKTEDSTKQNKLCILWSLLQINSTSRLLIRYFTWFKYSSKNYFLVIVKCYFLHCTISGTIWPVLFWKVLKLTKNKSILT